MTRREALRHLRALDKAAATARASPQPSQASASPKLPQVPASTKMPQALASASPLAPASPNRLFFVCPNSDWHDLTRFDDERRIRSIGGGGRGGQRAGVQDSPNLLYLIPQQKIPVCCEPFDITSNLSLLFSDPLFSRFERHC